MISQKTDNNNFHQKYSKNENLPKIQPSSAIGQPQHKKNANNKLRKSKMQTKCGTGSDTSSQKLIINKYKHLQLIFKLSSELIQQQCIVLRKINNIIVMLISHNVHPSKMYECYNVQGIFQNMLADLRQEILLKTDALKCASQITKKLQGLLVSLEKQNEELRICLAEANEKIANLEQQLHSGHSLKSIKQYPQIQSPNRGSFTKTYITQKNIPIQQQNKQLTTIISAQIFNEFCKNYTDMIGQLGSYLQKQKTSEDNYVQKLENMCIQVQDLLSGKLDEQYSKTTYDTGFADSEYHYYGNSSTKRTMTQSLQPTPPLSSSSPIPPSQYQHLLTKYRQLCVSLSYQLNQSRNYIIQLSQTMQKYKNMLAQSPQPHSLVPSQLIKLITKECNKIIGVKFTEMKQQNLELIHIIEEMIRWIEKNSRDGGDKFRGEFSGGVF